MSLVCQSRLLTVLVHGSIPHWHRGAFLDARSVMISLLARGPNWIAAHPAILAASHCRYLWLGAGGEHAVGAGLMEELQLHNLTVCEFQTQQMDQKRVVCDHLSATENIVWTSTKAVQYLRLKRTASVLQSDKKRE